MKGTFRQWINGADVRYSVSKRKRRRIRGKRRYAMRDVPRLLQHPGLMDAFLQQCQVQIFRFPVGEVITPP